MRDRPEAVLTRHFFASLFDFGFLSDEGAESLKRAMLGSLAVMLAIGLLLVRVFMAKYGEFNAIYMATLPSPYPARTFIAVADLPANGQVEIEAIAIRKR